MFTKRIMDSIDCQYFRCSHCGALQTQEPTWLEESYGPKFHTLGIHSAYRTIWSQAFICYLYRVLGLKGRILDYGGGTGLLTRLLRDVGHDAYHFDRYSANVYAKDFADVPSSRFGMVAAFEVFEHFPKPLAEAEEVFCGSPDTVVVGTGLYKGQGPDWNYLYPEHGQHVFFWSVGAHEWLGKKLGYHVTLLSDQQALYSRRKLTFMERTLAKTSPLGAKMTQMLIPLSRRQGLSRDAQATGGH